MLATLLIWTYILFLAFIYGWISLELFRRFFLIDTEIGKVAWPLIPLLGLCVLNTFAALLSLFVNLGWLAQTLILLPAVVLGRRLWRDQVRPAFNKLSLPVWTIVALFVLLFLTILESNTHPPVNPDTGIYHAQAIRWMETYPAVPGLGNLHSRLAYNSNWLVIHALFSFVFVGLRSFHVLHGIFLLLVLVYFLGGAQKLLQKEIGLAAIFKTLCIPIVFYTIGAQISSPGTDFPTTIWVWLILALWLEILQTKSALKRDSIYLEEVILFTFSVYILTIKLSALPVLFVSLYILIKHIRQPRRIAIRLMLLGVIILTPWLARNFILSGYWIYPLSALAPLSPEVDWKIPLFKVVEEQRGILAWARIPGADADTVLAMPLHKWLEEWFLNRTRNQQFLILGAALSPFFYALFYKLSNSKKWLLPEYSLIYATAYIGLLFWLFSAPDIRFGYGFIIGVIFLVILPPASRLLENTRFSKFLISILIFTIIIYQAVVFYQSIEFRTLGKRILLPEDYPTLSTHPCEIYNYTLYCADYYNECWYDPFPCIPPCEADMHVELRGDTLQSGFRFIQNP